MSKVRELTGTPWHVEKLTRNEGDERRHKSRCIYYFKKTSYCKLQHIKCRGSRYCQYYKVKEIKEKNIHVDIPIKKKVSVDKITDTEGMNLYPVGSKVRHKKFGDGYVVGIADGHIIIDFEEAGKKILGLDICDIKGYLEMIEKADIPEKADISEKTDMAEKADNIVSDVIDVHEDKIDNTYKAEENTAKKNIFGWLGKLFSRLFIDRKND